MDVDQLTRDMVDPIVTMTVAASGKLKNKRSRNDLDSIQVDEDKAGVTKKVKPTDNRPTMLVLTCYASIEHDDGTVPPYYFVLVNRMKKPEENIHIAVFDDDNSMYQLPPNKDDNRGATLTKTDFRFTVENGLSRAVRWYDIRLYSCARWKSI